MENPHNNKQHIRRIVFDLIDKGGDKKEFLFWLDIYGLLDEKQKEELYLIILDEFKQIGR